MRNVINFNKNWYFSKTSLSQECMADDALKTGLPHTWNAVDGQDGGNDYWRGTASYYKTFARPELPPGGKAILEVNGAAMTAEVFLNGKKLIRHEGGYSTFRTDLTDGLAEQNTLCITVDNSSNDSVYPQKADFTFYGGLYRDVNLIIVPGEHFDLLTDGGPGIRVTPCLDLNTRTADVAVETWQNAARVTLTLEGESQTVTSHDGYATGMFHLKDLRLWDGPDAPCLYTVSARLDSGDEISISFGCRTMEIDARRGFLLNGREYPLRGVSRHQDRKGAGIAISRKDMEEDLAAILEVGANSVRLAHYQHDSYFYELCDRAGIVVWAEIPYITRHMDGGNANTHSMMRELITQCRHHPSIACWGLSNEITAAGDVNENMRKNHLSLNALCHQMDPTRPTVMAHAFMLETDSPMLQITDANAYNLYFGWYLGTLEQNNQFFDTYHAQFPERPIGFSEYGADANIRFHAKNPDAGDYSEEYQCIYHEHILKLIEERPWLWCAYAWNLFDFAADGRDEGGEHGLNQKGLISFDRKVKKDAFYLYKAHWSKEPFVHLCGRRYICRDGETTEIKLYTNQPSVTLYLDGEEKETRAVDRSAVFTVPITGKHQIRAKAGLCEDSIEIEKVNAPFDTYLFQKDEIINWFDRDEPDPAFFSLEDTMGAVSAHPKAGKILTAVMDTVHASRGEVAQAAGNNAYLMQMMSSMTLRDLFKKAGDSLPRELIRETNEKLQKIRKV